MNYSQSMRIYAQTDIQAKVTNASPHKIIEEILIELKKEGHKIILWTNRGDNDKYKVLTEAIDWCKSKGLEFDAINENLPDQKKISGYSPKIMADFYIDDKALQFGDGNSRRKSLQFIKKNF